MEVFRPKSWETRKGREKFANKKLAKIRKKFEKDKSLSKQEKKLQLDILKKCKKKIIKILELPIKDELPIT